MTTRRAFLLLHTMHGMSLPMQAKCNGYYTSGIFNTKAGAVEREYYDSNATSNDNFNWAFHIITYNHPN